MKQMLLIMLLAGCSTPSAQPPANVPNANEQLKSSLKDRSFQAECDASSTEVVEYSFSESSVVKTTFLYKDSGCKEGLTTSTSVISPLVINDMNLEVKYTTLLVNILTQDYVELFNQYAVCGGDFRLNRSKDITQCSDVTVSDFLVTENLSIVLNGNELILDGVVYKE